MPVKGRKPGAPGVSRNRHAPAHTWTEVDDAPFDGGPDLPKHRAGGKPWPDGIAAKWDAWRSMPHAGLWQASDWQFAFDTIEIAAAFIDGGTAGLAAELRNTVAQHISKSAPLTYCQVRTFDVRDRPVRSKPLGCDGMATDGSVTGGSVAVRFHA